MRLSAAAPGPKRPARDARRVAPHVGEMPAGGRAPAGASNGSRYDPADRPAAAPYNQRGRQLVGGSAWPPASSDDPSVGYDAAIDEADTVDPASLADRYDRPTVGSRDAVTTRGAARLLPHHRLPMRQPGLTMTLCRRLPACGPLRRGDQSRSNCHPAIRRWPGRFLPGPPGRKVKKWLRGDTRYVAIHRGRTYLFGSEGCQKKFLSDPDRFSPVLEGNDVIVALESGQAVPGRREFGVFYSDRVYLFANQTNRDRFEHEHQRLADAASKTGQVARRTKPPSASHFAALLETRARVSRSKRRSRARRKRRGEQAVIRKRAARSPSRARHLHRPPDRRRPAVTDGEHATAAGRVRHHQVGGRSLPDCRHVPGGLKTHWRNRARSSSSSWLNAPARTAFVQAAVSNRSPRSARSRRKAQCFSSARGTGAD